MEELLVLEEDFGMGTIKECFQSEGTQPKDRDKLKIWVRGETIEWAVCLSIQVEMKSGPEAESRGRLAIKERN